jgi:CRP-like cAMP-binding protein
VPHQVRSVSCFRECTTEYLLDGLPHQVRSVSCFRECTEAFLLEVCALLHTELVVPNSFIAQTGDVTTGILILTKGEAHRRLKLRNSAPDAAAASLLAQHSTPSAAEPKGAREGAATSVSVSSFDLSDLALSSAQLDRTDHSIDRSTQLDSRPSPPMPALPAGMDLFQQGGLGVGGRGGGGLALALPGPFLDGSPGGSLAGRFSLEKLARLESVLYGDRSSYSPGGTARQPTPSLQQTLFTARKVPSSQQTLFIARQQIPAVAPARTSIFSLRPGAKLTDTEADRVSEVSSSEGRATPTVDGSPSASSTAPSFSSNMFRRAPDPLHRREAEPALPRAALPDVMVDAIANTILIEKVDEGGNIGAEEFVLGITHRYDILAVQMCECMQLRRKPFNELLSRFAELGPTIRANALDAIRASTERDEAAVRNFIRSPEVPKRLGVGNVFGLGDLGASGPYSLRVSLAGSASVRPGHRRSGSAGSAGTAPASLQRHRRHLSDGCTSVGAPETGAGGHGADGRACQVPGKDSASIAAAEVHGQEKATAARDCGRRLHPCHRILDAATKRLASSHAWSLLLFILLLYRMCGDTFRASLQEHFALPIEWSEALQLTPALYRDRLEANEAWGYQPWPLYPQPTGAPTAQSPSGVQVCDPRAPGAQQYYDSVGLCVFDFFVDVAIGIDLLVAQLHTVGGSAASTARAADAPTTARRTARHLLFFSLLFLVAVLVLDILSIAVAGVRSGGGAVSDAAAQTASIVWAVRLPLLVLLPRHLYSLEAWLLERSPSTDIQHVRLGRMLLAIFVTSHLAGCIWAIIGLRDFQATFVSNTSEHTWSAYSWWAGDVLIIEGVASCQSLAVLAWLRGVYIAFGTLLIIPIGDVAPTTMNETYIMLFFILVLATVVAAVEGTVVNVIAAIGKDEHMEECVLANTKKVMMSHAVPPVLQDRVVRYLIGSAYRGVGKNRAVLSKLPPQLQLETSKAIRLELLLKTKLADLLPRAVLGYITKEMSDVFITPGELLMIEGDTGTYDMYVVVEGIFEIVTTGGRLKVLQTPVQRRKKAEALLGEKMSFTEQQIEHIKSQVVATVSSGAVLGEVSFFLQGTARNASVRAVTRAHVIQLTRRQLDAACALFGLHRDAAFLAKLESLVRTMGVNQRLMNERIVREAMAEEASLPGTSDTDRSRNVGRGHDTAVGLAALPNTSHAPSTPLHTAPRSLPFRMLAEPLRWLSLAIPRRERRPPSTAPSAAPSAAPSLQVVSVSAEDVESSAVTLSSDAGVELPNMVSVAGVERVPQPAAEPFAQTVAKPSARPPAVEAPASRQSSRRPSQERALPSARRPATPRRHVYPPSTLPRMLWEWLMTVISFYLAISIPFIIAAFGPRSPVSVDSAWAILATQWACDAILLCDSVLRANCFPFLPRGREVFMKSELTHSAMRAHYVQAKLRLDVLATLPYEALAPIGFATTSDTKTILLAVALLRLPRLLRCSRCLEHFRVAFGWLPPQLCLSKAQSRMLLVWSLWLYVVHAFTCFFLFDAYTLPLSALGRNWMTEDIAWKRADWAHETIGHSYARAAHFVLSHMATPGVGDVRPQNAWETGFIMVLVLATTGLYSCVIGFISSYARLGDVEEELLMTQTDYLQHYMRNHPLPHRLAKRITSYYRLLSSNPRVSHAHLLQELPIFLRRDLGLWMHRDHLLNVPALANLSFFPLVELCVALQPELFLEGDNVIAKGAPATKLYLVDVGKLLVHSGSEPAARARYSETETDLSKSPPPTPTARRRSLLFKDAPDVHTAVLGTVGVVGTMETAGEVGVVGAVGTVGTVGTMETAETVEVGTADLWTSDPSRDGISSGDLSGDGKVGDGEVGDGKVGDGEEDTISSRRHSISRVATDAALEQLRSVSRGFVVGRKEAVNYVGVEMIAFNGSQSPVLYERFVEAATHCHLFGLSLGAWKGLCTKFADELGPISRGEAGF